MAKLALTLTLFISFLVAFSYASAESDSESSLIRLPTEKPESDPETTPFVVKLDTSDGESLPVKLIRFRPVNCRFRRRPFPSAFRHGGRRFGRDGIPYGRDMILSSDPGLHGGPRQIHPRWIDDVRRDEPRFPFGHGGDGEWAPRHHHHHRHRHDRHDEYDHDHDHHHGHDHHDEHGFLNSFRKFLGHF